MSSTSPAGERHLSLDVIRGAAVMGILVANAPAFALPMTSYHLPVLWGGTAPADVGTWLATFVLIEGKMRGLFSFLFGASTLLIIERAERAGESAAAVHFSRMAVLFAIGLVHLYLIWWGDILAHYALVGSVAFLFRRLQFAQLVGAGLAVLAFSWLWTLTHGPGAPSASAGLAEIAAMRGTWAEGVAYRWQHGFSPLVALQALGPETLAAMLLGMAAYRSGFLSGSLPRGIYRRWSLAGLGIALPAYLLLGLGIMRTGYDPAVAYLLADVATVPFRILGTVGYAALIMLLLRPGGWLTSRMAAVGRAAFTNYLASSLLMTAIFYGWGLGLFGTLPRWRIALLPPLAWLLMLAWSRPWLERYRYGPFEWLWRSVARGKPQPMRRVPA